MMLRRGLYRSLWVAVIVLPLWILLGRSFFGAPLGFQFVAQILLVPILFVVQAVAVGLVFFRSSNRSKRAVSWLDSGLLALTWLGQLGVGFFLVDSATSRPEASAFTALAGSGQLSLSTALSAVSIVLTIAAGAALLFGSIWQSVNHAKAGLRAALADMDRVLTTPPPSPPEGGPRIFPSDPDRTIRITPRG